MYITAEIGRRLTENMGSVCYQKYIGQGQRVFLSIYNESKCDSNSSFFLHKLRTSINHSPPTLH